MQVIAHPLLDSLSANAQAAPRLRAIHNFHAQYTDPINRMLNAMEPGTYVAPHKHQEPDKREVFVLLRGRLLVVQFDDEGRIAQHTILDHATGHYGVEMPPRTYHTLVSLAPGTVIYELKDGPYHPATDKQFAPWAPQEGQEGCAAYLQNLLQACGLG